MKKPNPIIKWTYEKLLEEALKYNTRNDFNNNSSSAYSIAATKGILKEICQHMEWKCTPPDTITKNDCQIEALKYNSRSDFYKYSGKRYRLAYEHNWLDEICSHMIKIGNRYNRCIYSYEFSDNSVYVGLTYNLDNRQKQRNKDIDDAVTKHIDKTGLIPIRKQLTDYIDVQEASKLEGYYVEKYEKEGWYILNRMKTGGIGGDYIKWTFELCQKEALKYNSKSEFNKKSKSVYVTAYNNKWLDKICTHMIPKRRLSNSYTYEECKEIAKKYKSKSKFEKSNYGIYNAALKNNWLDDICSHMKPKDRLIKSYTYDECKEIAKNYKSRTEFEHSGYYGAYKASLINGWIDDICSHMITKKLVISWTYKECKEEALKYKTRTEFKNNSNTSYRASYNNHWLDEFYPKKK
jgi:hypothetical protein